VRDDGEGAPASGLFLYLGHGWRKEWGKGAGLYTLGGGATTSSKFKDESSKRRIQTPFSLMMHLPRR
jgi:hypothetical protein